MNCIFICIFNNVGYVNLFFLLLESIYLYGNLQKDTDILVYTTTEFMNIIKNNILYSDIIKFEINDSYCNIDSACKARLDLFYLPSITMYKKILYMDTDIIIKNDINRLFKIPKDDILYVLEEGYIDDYHEENHWGQNLFGQEVYNYEDKSAFTTGIMLFKNCENIKFLFDKTREYMIQNPHIFNCYDQPYIVYNAFKYKLFNNKVMKSYAINVNYEVDSDIIIHHFPGGVGNYEKKYTLMLNFLKNVNEYKENML
jgi:lipopolysaccharide biosynthesis glycosyltransferase